MSLPTKEYLDKVEALHGMILDAIVLADELEKENKGRRTYLANARFNLGKVRAGCIYERWHRNEDEGTIAVQSKE